MYKKSLLAAFADFINFCSPAKSTACLIPKAFLHTDKPYFSISSFVSDVFHPIFSFDSIIRSLACTINIIENKAKWYHFQQHCESRIEIVTEQQHNRTCAKDRLVLHKSSNITQCSYISLVEISHKMIEYY